MISAASNEYPYPFYNVTTNNDVIMMLYTDNKVLVVKVDRLIQHEARWSVTYSY